MSCAISDCHALCIDNRTDDTGKLALCHIPIWDEFLSCPNACTIAYNSDSWNVGQSCLLAFDDVFCAISKTPYYDRRSAFFAPLVLDSDKIYCLDDKYLKIISENRINEMEIIKQTKKKWSISKYMEDFMSVLMFDSVHLVIHIEKMMKRYGAKIWCSDYICFCCVRMIEIASWTT